MVLRRLYTENHADDTQDGSECLDLEDDVPNEPKSNPVKDDNGHLKRHDDRERRSVTSRPHYDKENRAPRS